MSTSETPLGIRQLSGLSRVLIRQRMTGYFQNKYVVLAPDKTVVFYAKEDTGIIDRVLVAGRVFRINVFDTQNQEVIKLRRPYTMGSEKMDVSMCGKPVSVVRKEMTFFKPVININDASDRLALRIKGPLVTSGECDFDLYSTNKIRIGGIRKKWSGLGQELLSTADNYVIDFPADLDVRFKAAVIGTCFLIDFMFYEN